MANSCAWQKVVLTSLLLQIKVFSTSKILLGFESQSSNSLPMIFVGSWLPAL